MKTIAQRVLEGREAEQRLSDDFLNGVFDVLVEESMQRIVSAANPDQAWQHKLEIDAVMRVRKRLRVAVDDGLLAKQQQEKEDGTSRYQ